MINAAEMIMHEIAAVLAEINETDVEKLINAVRNAHRIFCCGAGRSGLMMKAFAMRLAQMGLCVYVTGETITPAIEKGDLLVAASASGETDTICLFTEKALSEGADLFIISAKESSRLSARHAVDVLLSAPDKDTPGGSSQALGSLFEQSLLIFCDAVVYALHGGKEEMRKRHANME